MNLPYLIAAIALLVFLIGWIVYSCTRKQEVESVKDEEGAEEEEEEKT